MLRAGQPFEIDGGQQLVQKGRLRAGQPIEIVGGQQLVRKGRLRAGQPSLVDLVNR